MSFWSKVMNYFKSDESGDSCHVSKETAEPAVEQPAAPVEETPADDGSVEENPPQA